MHLECKCGWQIGLLTAAKIFSPLFLSINEVVLCVSSMTMTDSEGLSHVCFGTNFASISMQIWLKIDTRFDNMLARSC